MVLSWTLELWSIMEALRNPAKITGNQSFSVSGLSLGSLRTYSKLLIVHRAFILLIKWKTGSDFFIEAKPLETNPLSIILKFY